MKKYKVYVYAISKNEEKFVDRWMDAVQEADQVFVLDTGSTDRTVEKLRARGAVVKEAVVSPWRFDTARNLAMDMLPDDADICVSNDLDEVFIPGWRAMLEKAWQPGHTRARHLFTFSFHPDGTPNKQFVSEKIHCRHGYRWVHPVHEVLRYEDGAERPVWVEGLVLNHYPDLEKSRGQYLPLLKLSAEENSQDDRVVFWLGREYYFYKQYDACIETLQKHLLLPSARWDEERCASMRYIARSLAAKGEKQQALGWFYKAIGECPQVREPYLDLAQFAYRENNWALVFAAVSQALKVTRRSGSYLTDDAAWGSLPYDLGAIACYHLGLLAQAVKFAKQACEHSPEDPRLQANLKLMLEKEGSDAAV